MHRTLVIRREYLHFVPKYARYEKRHKNLAAHVSPAFRVEEGDTVTVGQCRPLSKTVSRDLKEDQHHTDRKELGPIQRVARPSPNWQSSQVIPEILKRAVDEGLTRLISRALKTSATSTMELICPEIPHFVL